ncbi:hypothetical protein ONZ45_g18196 [Pleurotus djamor]|nr:hypothetical protein ONZ45_g18196 [Pleurotus djamor]
MGRSNKKAWTTEAEAEWLRLQIPMFDNIKRTAVKKKAELRKFWVSTRKQFIDLFCEGDLPSKSARELLTKRLKQWFHNHTRVAGGWRQVLNLRPKKLRRLSARQAYSNLYYKTKISPVVDKEWREQENYVADSVPPIDFINKITARLWEAESTEVVEEVKVYIEEEYESRVESKGKGKGKGKGKEREGEGDSSSDDDSSDDDESGHDQEEEMRRKLVQSRYESSKLLSATGVAALRQITEETGYMGVFALVGADPSEGGNLSTVFCHNLMAPNGKTVEDKFPTFASSLDRILMRFGEVAIPSSEREKASLPGTEHKRNYDASSTQPQASSSSRSPPSSSRSSSQTSTATSSSEATTSPPPPSRPRPGPRSRTAAPTAPRDLGPPTTIHPDIVARVAPIPAPAASSDEAPDVTMADATMPALLVPYSDSEESDDDSLPVPGKCKGKSVAEGDSDEEEDSDQPDGLPEPLASLVAAFDKDSFLHTAVPYLASLGKDHDRFNDLLVPFVMHERHFLGNLGILPKNYRPIELSHWIHNGRRPQSHTQLNEVDATILRQQTIRWWYSMQPDERSPANKLPIYSSIAALRKEPLANAEEWSHLAISSRNGIYGVLVSMAWWIEAGMGENGASDAFNDLIDDILWVFGQLRALPPPVVKKPSARTPQSSRTPSASQSSRTPSASQSSSRPSGSQRMSTRRTPARIAS